MRIRFKRDNERKTEENEVEKNPLDIWRRRGIDKQTVISYFSIRKRSTKR